ncbi:hypothetical protein HMPREF3192_00266 [Atopobium deltae]|uniref:Uncharacterized protein n=1 Tax=Atopobium deltae TaxID=1393034 RepID=A0A133XWS0_9ACTN|nr:hypothetical protein HMPREF3192_00266 [Atopobium deltae]
MDRREIRAYNLLQRRCYHDGRATMQHNDGATTAASVLLR